jgi:hypothetical protein
MDHHPRSIMAVKTVARKNTRKPGEPKPGPKTVESQFAEFQTLKTESELIAKRQKTLRDALLAEVQAAGIVDEKGSLYLALKRPIEVAGKVFRTLKSERRVSVRVDETAAEELLAEKGLLERAQKTVVVFDPDMLYVLNQEGLLSDDELDELMVSSESWAFKPLTEEVEAE